MICLFSILTQVHFVDLCFTAFGINLSSEGCS